MLEVCFNSHANVQLLTEHEEQHVLCQSFDHRWYMSQNQDNEICFVCVFIVFVCSFFNSVDRREADRWESVAILGNAFFFLSQQNANHFI